MVRSGQHGLTRHSDVRGGLHRGSRRDSGPRIPTVAVLAAAVLLVAGLAIGTTGCGSDSQTSSNATVASGATTGQSSAAQDSTSPSVPSGMPAGTPPGGPGGSTTSSDSSTTTTAEPTTTTTEATTSTTSLADGQYGDGIYRAGVDIAAGLYRGTAVGDAAHWEITSDANGARYVAGGDPTGQFYVKVTWGQYLRLDGVLVEKASSSASDPLLTTDISDGTYRAGYDIETGWYAGQVTGLSTIGYWQVASDANGQTLKASDYPRGSFELKVTSGQYLTLRGVTISLKE